MDLKRNLIIFIFFQIIVFTSGTFAEVKISALAELSGSFASFGEDCRKGYVIAEKYLKPEGLGLKVLYGDHQRDAKTGISEFNRLSLIDKSIGFSSDATPAVMAFSPIALQRKIPVMAVSAHPKLLDNPYMFRFWFNSKKEGEGIAQMAKKQGIKNIGLITIQDEYPLAVSQDFRKKIAELGSKIVVDEEVLKTESDYSSIVAKVVASHSDGLFLNFIGDSLGVFIKKLREQNYNKPIFTTFSITKKEVNDIAGGEKAIEGITFLDLDTERPVFVEKMRKEFGDTKVLGLQYACYSAQAMIMSAFKRNPKIQTSKELYEAALSIHEVELLDEKLPIVNRESDLKLVFKRMEGGKAVEMR